MLMYTIPMDMQPSSGETSSIAHTPQKANSSAMDTIRRLSAERLPSRSFKSTPNTPPSPSTPRLMARGLPISSSMFRDSPLPAPMEEMATEMAME